MALQVLNTDTPIHQKAEHDIESVFYVLLYVCMKLNGPDSWLNDSCNIDKWFMPQPFKELGFYKAGFLQYFHQILESDLSDYFAEFSELFVKLHLKMFVNNRFIGSNRSPGNVALHQPILAILKLTYDSLPDIDPVQQKRKAPKRKATEAVVQLKSKRTIASWDGPITPSRSLQSPGHNMLMSDIPARPGPSCDRKLGVRK
jgi:hypothetical protein